MKKNATRLVPPVFIDVNRGSMVSMKIGIARGDESNQVPARNAQAGQKKYSSQGQQSDQKCAQHGTMLLAEDVQTEAG